MVSTEAAAIKLGASPELAKAIEDACIGYGIDTTLRKMYFLSQCAHETAGFRYMREIWGPTTAQKGYEGRKDLGNTEPGDGKKFMGRGLIQCTGRTNYTDYSLDEYGDHRCVESPWMLEQIPDAALVAGWYWKRRGINKLADADDIEGVTRRVNGGLNGIKDREDWLIKAKRAFASLTA